MKLLLIDGDVMRYRCGFAAQHTRYTVDMDDQSVLIRPYAFVQLPATFANAKDANAFMAQHKEVAEEYGITLVRTSFDEVEPVANALHSVKHTMAGIQELWPDYHPCIYVSCPTAANWRTQFYPEYKANRKDARKPEHGPAIDEYMRAKWDVIDHPTKEADDLIAEQAYNNNYVDCVVCTNDKDMMQIPCTNYNWVTEVTVMQDGMSALRCLAAQRMAGDSTDNIKGIPNWGVKTATDMMQQSDIADLEQMLTAICRNALDRAGNLIYSTPEEADYNLALTTALVTLPVSDEHRERLIDKVTHEKSNYSKTQTTGEHTGDTGGGAE